MAMYILQVVHTNNLKEVPRSFHIRVSVNTPRSILKRMIRYSQYSLPRCLCTFPTFTLIYWWHIYSTLYWGTLAWACHWHHTAWCVETCQYVLV